MSNWNFDNVENMSFPIIAKPIKGFGSKGIYKLNTITDFHEIKEKLVKDYIFQPIIGRDSEEYTVGAFFDFNSNLIDSISFKRKLSNDGYTSEAELVDIEINSILDELADILKPIGPTNFQFRYSDKKFYLIEINPKFWGSVDLAHHAGVDFGAALVSTVMDDGSYEKQSWRETQVLWPLDGDLVSIYRSRKLSGLVDYFKRNTKVIFGESFISVTIKILWSIKKIVTGNSIYEMQSENNNSLSIEQDETLASKEIEIIGLYDPAKNGLNINMWKNSDGYRI